MILGYTKTYNCGYKFNIGDRVRILREIDIKPSWDWDPESMGKYCEKETTVTNRFKKKDTGKNYYHLAVDDGKYFWTNEMLEKATQENKKRKATLDDLKDSIKLGTFGEYKEPAKKEADVKGRKDDDVYTPEVSVSKFISDLCFCIDELMDIGKLNGDFECKVNKDGVIVTADLEGDRNMRFEIRRK